MKLKSKLKLYEQFINENSTKSTTDVAIDQTTVPTGNTGETIRTEVIRDVDSILNNLIELSDRIGESASIDLEIDELYEELYDLTNMTSLNEGIIDIIKSPIKYMKIQKNMKAYQKSLVGQAINDVDFAKKKQAAGEEGDAKTKDVLDKANKAKNQSFKDEATAVSDRMTELSKGDEGLTKVVSLGKTKSKLTAARMVMKATAGEENKQLKLEIGDLENRIADDEKSLKDYAKAETDKKQPDEVDPRSAEEISKDQLDGPGGSDKGGKKPADEKPATEKPADETDTEKLDAAVTKAQEAKDKLPEDASPVDKAKADVAVFTAKIAVAKAKGEDTKDLEGKLAAAQKDASLQVQQVGGVKDEGMEIDLSFDAALVEASLNGLMAYDADGDDYAYLKKQAKKLGVKVSVDVDPFGDGYDELDYSGDKAAILKLAKISGHDSDITSGPEEGGYWIEESVKEEMPKTIKLDEGLSVAQKFARLMNK